MDGSSSRRRRPLSSGGTPLPRGNVTSGVVRVGCTVRRPAGPWTPAVHALLRHLHAVGFSGAPWPHGTDERGREVLSFVPGVVAWPDHVELLADDRALARVGRLVRDLHDAAAGFTPPPDAQWQVGIPAPDGDLIVHNDVAPWNLVIGDEGWVLIDWDGAAPGSRLWDLAYAMHGFAPLSAAAGPDGVAVQAHRVRVLAGAYGLDEAGRRGLLPLLARRAMSMHQFLAEGAANGVEPWARLWADGHGESWRADAEYIGRHRADWERALLD